MGNPMLKAALEYVKAGYSIIPLQPKDKKPVPGFQWAQYNESAATTEEVTKWWGRYPEANIGLITGKISGIVAVDIDTYKGGDHEKILKEMPTGMISRTGSGGYHLIYDYPYLQEDPVRNAVTQGVDIRGDRGYIVVPPSVHQNGRKYEWIQKGPRNIFDPTLLKQVYPDIDEDLNHSSRWITEIMKGVSSGNRNASAAKLAGYYLSKGIPKDICLALMQEWNHKNDPPMADEELETVVESVSKTAQRTKTPARKENKAGCEGSTGFDLMGFDAYMSNYGEATIKWTIDDWLPAETIAFMVSPPGSYKTWLLLDLAVSVAGGKPFLGEYEVNETGPVIIVQQEDFHGQLAERVATIVNSRYGMMGKEGDGEFTLPPKLPIYFHTERKLRFHDPEVMEEFEKIVNEVKPKLVVIDPLYSTTSTDDYMSKTAETMFPLKRMRDKVGCTFVLAHHTKKGLDSNQREGLWGSQFLNAFLETGWQIRKTDQPSIVTILRHFKVRGAMEQLRLEFDINTDFPYHYFVKVGEDADEPTQDILHVLNTSGAMSISEIANKTGIHRSTISRRLKLMEKDGVVFKEGNKYTTIESITTF